MNFLSESSVDAQNKNSALPAKGEGENLLHVSGDDANWPASASHLVDLNKFDTSSKILRYNASEFSNDVAQRYKDFGIWQTYTWHDVYEKVRKISAGLIVLGVEKGCVTALIGDNRPYWVWCQWASQLLGGCSMGIYRDALEEEIRHLVLTASPQVIYAEDEEQYDKLLQVDDALKSVQVIIYQNLRGMNKYNDSRLISIDDLEELGSKYIKINAENIDNLIDATKADDCAVLCTTSGTTALPKLSYLTHKAILNHSSSYATADPKGPDDEYLCMLPLSWVLEQTYSISWNLIARMKVNFAEENNTLMDNLREVSPTFIMLSPRIWEQISSEINTKILEAAKWKRSIYNYVLSLISKDGSTKKTSWLAEILLFRALRDRLGLGRLKSASTGGAAMAPETFSYFQAMGVPLNQIYGQTEALGAYTIHCKHRVDPVSVGMPMPGCELRISNPDAQGLGEIQVRHKNMMQGYYNNEQETKKAFSDDGWLKTGDAGYFQSSSDLVVIDRLSDLSHTSNGYRFSPQYIENKLKFSPYIAEAVIFGSERNHITTMLCIRFSVVSKWAELKRISFTTYSDLSSQDAVYNLIKSEIIAANKTLPAAQRIKKFTLLYKELDADDGELTRTRKVRRKIVAEKYADIIDMLYSENNVMQIDKTINFQDGSTQRIRTKLRLESTQ